MSYEETTKVPVAQPAGTIYVQENPPMAAPAFNSPQSANVVYRNVGRNISKPTLLSNLMCITGGVVAWAGFILLIIGSVDATKYDHCVSTTCCSGTSCKNGGNFDDCYCCSGNHCPPCPDPYIFIYDVPTCTAYNQNSDLFVSGLMLLILGPILLCCPVCCAMCYDCGHGTLLTYN